MRESFSSFWLSRAALIALVVYVSSAYRIWRLSPRAAVNRLAALLCLDLAVWALQAAVSYAADSPQVTVALSRALSWSWPFFPALGVNFALEINESTRTMKGAIKALVLVALYGSALTFYYLLSWPLLMGAVRRAGYWSVDIRAGLGFSAFSAYYLGLNLIGMYLVAMTWLRSKIPLERKRLGIFVIVHAISLFGGFMTDTILFSLGIDFPKVGVLWAGIWAVGVNVAMERYAFLAPFSPRVMGLLMDRFIERSLDGIMVSDAGGRIIYWNAPLVELTGIRSDEAIGSSMDSIQAMLTPPDALQGSMPDRITDAMKQHPDAPGHLVELEILARDGQIRWLQTSVFTIPTDSGEIWAFILRDSTDQKRIAALTIERMQRQSHAQKMEALGSLAGGIAHDFNNTLGGILGAVSLIRACLDDGDGSQPIDFSRELEVIYQSSQRAASSVRGLMAFTIDTPQKKGQFRLDESVRRVAELVSRTMDRSVRVRLADLPTDAQMNGDAPQIEQLILNLVINAGHSMTIMRPIGAAKGGTITLSICPRDLDESEVPPEAKAGRYWILSVADQGVGMDKKTLAKAFDPFFTTTATDQGSGLGLSMVHLIARQHGGFVEVESEPGVGSTFSVYLPAAAATVSAVRSN